MNCLSALSLVVCYNGLFVGDTNFAGKCGVSVNLLKDLIPTKIRVPEGVIQTAPSLKAIPATAMPPRESVVIAWSSILKRNAEGAKGIFTLGNPKATTPTTDMRYVPVL